MATFLEDKLMVSIISKSFIGLQIYVCDKYYWEYMKRLPGIYLFIQDFFLETRFSG